MRNSLNLPNIEGIDTWRSKTKLPRTLSGLGASFDPRDPLSLSFGLFRADPAAGLSEKKPGFENIHALNRFIEMYLQAYNASFGDSLLPEYDELPQIFIDLSDEAKNELCSEELKLSNSTLLCNETMFNRLNLLCSSLYKAGYGTEVLDFLENTFDRHKNDMFITIKTQQKQAYGPAFHFSKLICSLRLPGSEDLIKKLVNIFSECNVPGEGYRIKTLLGLSETLEALVSEQEFMDFVEKGVRAEHRDLFKIPLWVRQNKTEDIRSYLAEANTITWNTVVNYLFKLQDQAILGSLVEDISIRRLRDDPWVYKWGDVDHYQWCNPSDTQSLINANNRVIESSGKMLPLLLYTLGKLATRESIEYLESLYKDSENNFSNFIIALALAKSANKHSSARTRSIIEKEILVRLGLVNNKPYISLVDALGQINSPQSTEVYRRIIDHQSQIQQPTEENRETLLRVFKYSFCANPPLTNKARQVFFEKLRRFYNEGDYEYDYLSEYFFDFFHQIAKLDITDREKVDLICSFIEDDFFRIFIDGAIGIALEIKAIFLKYRDEACRVNESIEKSLIGENTTNFENLHECLRHHLDEEKDFEGFTSYDNLLSAYVGFGALRAGETQPAVSFVEAVRFFNRMFELDSGELVEGLSIDDLIAYFDPDLFFVNKCDSAMGFDNSPFAQELRELYQTNPSLVRRFTQNLARFVKAYVNRGLGNPDTIGNFEIWCNYLLDLEFIS